MEEEKKSSRIGSIIDHIKDFISTKISIYKLIAAEAGGKVASAIILGILLLFFALFFFIFLGIGVAIAIGNALGHLYLGFIIVAGLFLLLGFFLIAARRVLLYYPITNTIIKLLAGNDHED